MRRNSNLELLRIISMLLIVAHHFTLKSGALMHTQGVNRLITIFLYMGGKVGSNIFVIIGAWFLTDSKFDIKKIFNIWSETFFYSILIGLIYSLVNRSINLYETVKLFFPVFGEEYWFSSCYISLLVISPVLNVLIFNINKKLYLYAIVTLTFMLSVFPTILPWKTENYINNLLWFIFLYIITGYFKKYHIQISTKVSILSFLISYSMIFLTIIIFMNLEYTKGKFDIIINFANEFSFFVLISSIALFYIFVSRQECYNRIINQIANSTFGIYLIHMHPMVKDRLWEKIFKCSIWIDSPLYVVYALLSILSVFIFCFLIEFIRIKIFKKCFNLRNNSVIEKINNEING